MGVAPRPNITDRHLSALFDRNADDSAQMGFRPRLKAIPYTQGRPHLKKQTMWQRKVAWTLNKQTSCSSASHTKSEHSTVVHMDGVTIAMSHPELLKNLRPLPVANRSPVPDYDRESANLMEEFDSLNDCVRLALECFVRLYWMGHMKYIII